MQKQAPSASRLAVMIIFALSCLGIVLYLWTTFGGPTPLAAEGYRFQADFSEATTLADNAEVRISGVAVGHVIHSELHGEKTRATIEIDRDQAPVPRNTQAILRQKTLLGETYVELTPGDPRTGNLPDGGLLPAGQVRPTVELDEVLRAFDAKTRRALQRFLAGTAASLKGRGEDLNDSLGNTAPFASDANDVVQVLDSQEGAVRRLVHDTGVVFTALGRKQGQLSGLVRSGDVVLSTTARRNVELAESVNILPTTLRELRPTLQEIETVSHEAGPVVHSLRPAGRALAPTLRDLLPVAPQLQGLFRDVDRVTTASRTALPATTRTVKGAHALFDLLPDVLREALPIVDYLGLYKRELVTMFADDAAAMQGSEVQGPGLPRLHYLRALVPFTQEGLVAYDKRIPSNRHNAYLAYGGLAKLGSGLEAFDCGNTSDPGPSQPAPPCKVQQPFEFRGRAGAYPHVTRDR